jgi:hypothetical protein
LNRSRAATLLGSERAVVPLVAVHVVDRDERRLAAHRERTSFLDEVSIHARTERVHARPSASE